MTCLAPGGCHIGFIRSNRLPGGSDDACDTNNNGEYLCIGSYWLFDPNLAGADPLLGLCERLFVQTSDVCNMAEWLEISVPSIVEDPDQPVNGVDCCPPSSLWHATNADTYHISLNINGNCFWCQICGGSEDPHTSHSESACGGSILYDDFGGPLPLPPNGAPATNILPVSITFTNPSLVRSMDIIVSFDGYSAEFGFGDLDNDLTMAYVVTPNFYIDAVLQPVTGGAYDAGINISALDVNTFQLQMTTSGYTVARTIPPGGSETYSMDATLTANIEHNSDAIANVRIGASCISAGGSTV